MQTALVETSARDVVLNQEQKLPLIADAIDGRWANKPDKHRAADTQMHYDQSLHNCALGTSLRVFCGDKATGKITSCSPQRRSFFATRLFGG